MKIIKIFVSISFEQGVNEIADFISMLNDVYIQKDIYFEIRFNSDSGEKGSKNLQEKQSIEREIRECSFFYIIIGETFCNDMEKEFDLALSRFRDENLPLIYTYFSRLNKNPLPGRVHAFMRRLECELEHYYTLFETIDAVKLNMVLEIIRNTEGGKQVKVSNGNIYIEERQILSVKEIPVFKNNQELQALNQEYIELTEAFFDAKIRYSENTEDYGLFESLYKLGEKRKTVFEQISDLEQNIFDLCVLTSELKSRSHVGMRRRKACECIDAGNYKAALDLLRDPIREKELFIAKTGQNAAVNRIKEYIEEEKLAISALQGQRISADSIEETAAHYRKCVELIETYHVKFHLLYEYAGFLYDNGFYESAVHIGKKYQKYLDFFKASKSDAARNYYHIAQSYSMLGKKEKQKNT